jgi:hypothetical protein
MLRPPQKSPLHSRVPSFIFYENNAIFYLVIPDPSYRFYSSPLSYSLNASSSIQASPAKGVSNDADLTFYCLLLDKLHYGHIRLYDKVGIGSKASERSFVLVSDDSEWVFFLMMSLLSFLIVLHPILAFDLNDLSLLGRVFLAFLPDLTLLFPFVCLGVLIVGSLQKVFTHLPGPFFLLFPDLFLALVEVLLTLFGVILPDQSEDELWAVGGDRGFDVLVLDFYLDERFLVGPFRVIGEPVVEIARTDTPLWSGGVILEHDDLLDLREEYLPGGGEGEVVLVDDDEVLADSHLFVLVEDFGHYWKCIYPLVN